MKSIIVISLLLASLTETKSQKAMSDAHPAVGWDSLKSLIGYPEIAKRAGLQGYADVSVELDSLNNVGDIGIVGYDIFHGAIKNAVRRVSWVRGEQSGSRAVVVFFTVEFKLKPNESPRRNVLRIEAGSQ